MNRYEPCDENRDGDGGGGGGGEQYESLDSSILIEWRFGFVVDVVLRVQVIRQWGR